MERPKINIKPIKLIRIYLFFFAILPLFCYPQLHHQTISAYGSTSHKGITSVGQSSVSGNQTKIKLIASQGFINPIQNVYFIETVEQNLEVLVFPNPFNEFFEITLDNEYQEIEIRIQNTSGQIVFEKELNKKSKFQVHTPSLSNQTYLINVLADKKIFNAKLIKQ